MEPSVGAGDTAKEITLASLSVICYLFSVVSAYNCNYSLVYVLRCMFLKTLTYSETVLVAHRGYSHRPDYDLLSFG